MHQQLHKIKCLELEIPLYKLQDHVKMFSAVKMSAADDYDGTTVWQSEQTNMGREDNAGIRFFAARSPESAVTAQNDEFSWRRQFWWLVFTLVKRSQETQY